MTNKTRNRRIDTIDIQPENGETYEFTAFVLACDCDVDDDDDCGAGASPAPDLLPLAVTGFGNIVRAVL